jgi:hypothetical protein
MTIVEKMGGIPGKQTVSEMIEDSGLFEYKLMLASDLMKNVMFVTCCVLQDGEPVDHEKVQAIILSDELFKAMVEGKACLADNVQEGFIQIMPPTPTLELVGLDPSDYSSDIHVVSNDTIAIGADDGDGGFIALYLNASTTKVEMGTKEDDPEGK